MTDQYPPEYLELQRHRIPAGRIGDPRELAAAVVFLAGPGAGYITGQTLPVDGGMTISLGRAPSRPGTRRPGRPAG